MRPFAFSLLISTILHLALVFAVRPHHFTTETPPKPRSIKLTLFTAAKPKLDPQPSPPERVPPPPPPIVEKVEKPTQRQEMPRVNKMRIKRNAAAPAVEKKPVQHIAPHPTITKQEPGNETASHEALTRNEVAPPKISTEQIERAKTDYRNALRNAIEARKRYPNKARRMRQQGTVELGFTIDAAGTIHNLRITISSGNHQLDQAALRLISEIDGLLPFPADLHRRQWDFILPIEYRLD